MNIQELDFGHVNSAELSLLKKSNDTMAKESLLVSLFDKKLFPYIINKNEPKKEVKFFIGSHFHQVFPYKNAIRVAHRNRGGILTVDNGYHGGQPDDRDYYTIINVNPDFTNEHYVYSVSYYPRKYTDFGEAMLNKLAEQVIDVWDVAIEKNARMWG